jgi:hypothetical protein
LLALYYLNSQMGKLRFLLNRQRSNKRTLLLLVIPLFSCLSARAQYSNSDSRYGISIGSDYDAPVGNFSYTFKPTINYNLSLLHHYDNLTGSISFGYHQYQPKQDTFYYQANSTNYGTVSYKNFPVYSFYLGLTYDFAVTEQLKIYSGINLGVYYTHFAYHASDFLVDDTENLNEEDVYLAPRLGVTYMLNDNIGIGIEGKYNFFAPSGDSQYNDRVGTLYNSYSAGVRLTYNF